MSYSVSTNPYIGSGTGKFKKNGIYSIPIQGLQYSTTYSWTVSVTDGKSTVKKTYKFTTISQEPVVSNPYPTNGEGAVDVDYLSFTLHDPQGDLMNYSAETSPPIGSNIGHYVPNGTYIVPVNGLTKNKWYTWYVNVTDGTYWTRKKYVFFSGDIGLIGYWSFDEGSGDIAHDYSDNGNDGVIYGANWTIGVSNHALSLNGVNSYVDIIGYNYIVNFHLRALLT